MRVVRLITYEGDRDALDSQLNRSMGDGFRNTNVKDFGFMKITVETLSDDRNINVFPGVELKEQSK